MPSVDVLWREMRQFVPLSLGPAIASPLVGRERVLINPHTRTSGGGDFIDWRAPSSIRFQGIVMTPLHATFPDALARIRSEYLEMPDLSLTASQAERLLALNIDNCQAALETLVHSRFLARSRTGSYIRMDSR
jgi:hypothetical protein